MRHPIARLSRLSTAALFALAFVFVAAPPALAKSKDVKSSSTEEPLLPTPDEDTLAGRPNHLMDLMVNDRSWQPDPSHGGDGLFDTDPVTGEYD